MGRRPASRFGPLLIVFGMTAWVVSWQSSDWPLAFDPAVLAEAPYTILTFYLFQNAAKHAGPGAVATVRLTEDNGYVRFAIEDDGVGFEPRTVQWGAGLENITHRVSAAGGAIRIESATGHGTRVSGHLPA